MPKGRGHSRKKESRRKREGARSGERPGRGTLAPAAEAGPLAGAEPAKRGLDATRGPVSGAFRAWAADFGRRQVQAVAAGFSAEFGQPVPSELFLLAPLTTRTIETPGEETIAVQMGLPIVATRSGGVGLAPDNLAVAVLRLPETDAAGALGMLGMGQAPDLPPPELLFALRLPGEGLRGARPADALAWYLARAIEAGDVALDPRALAAAVGEALALLRPNVAPRGAARLDPAVLEAYDGYGAEADEQPVPLDITAPPARGGMAGLPKGAFLEDNGTPLAPLLADLRDYVIGLWPYEYFGLEALTADTADGADADATPRVSTPRVLADLADLVRRLDEVLAQGAETVEQALAAEGQPPAWIAEGTAPYRAAREVLRSTRTAQELLPRLGPVLFDLEIPPPDYAPEDFDEGHLDEETT